MSASFRQQQSAIADPSGVNVMIGEPTAIAARAPSSPHPAHAHIGNDDIKPARSDSTPLHTWRRYLSFLLSIVAFGLVIVALFTMWWVDANTNIGKYNMGLWSYDSPSASSSRITSSFPLGRGFYTAGLATLICCVVGLFFNLIVLILTLNMLSRHTRTGHDIVVICTWISGLIYLLGALLYELLRESFNNKDMGYNWSATLYLIGAICMNLGAWFLLWETSAITPSTVPLQSIATLPSPAYGIRRPPRETMSGFTDVVIHQDDIDRKEPHPPIPIEDHIDVDQPERVHTPPPQTLRVTSTEATGVGYQPKGFEQALRDSVSSRSSSRSSSGSHSGSSSGSSRSGSHSRSSSGSRSGSDSRSHSNSSSRSGSHSGSPDSRSPRTRVQDDGAQETGTVIGVDGVARQIRGAISHHDSEFDMDDDEPQYQRPSVRQSIIAATARQLTAVDNTEFSTSNTTTPRHGGGRGGVIHPRTAAFHDPRYARQDTTTVHLPPNTTPSRTTVHLPQTQIAPISSQQRLSRRGNPLPPRREGEQGEK